MDLEDGVENNHYSHYPFRFRSYVFWDLSLQGQQGKRVWTGVTKLDTG